MQIDEASDSSEAISNDENVNTVLRAGGFSKDSDSFENEYDAACNKLQLNSIPKELPCREKEIK